MNTFFLYIMRFSLSIIIGGVTVMGAIVAPLAFTMITPLDMASNMMVAIFTRFNYAMVAGSAAIFISEIARAHWIGGFRKILENHKFRLFLTMVLVGVSIYIAFWVTPELDSLRNTLTPEGVLPGKFGRFHRLSEVLYSANFLTALVLVFLFRNDD